MKRFAGLLMVLVVLEFGLLVAGCAKKEEASSPAEKSSAAPKGVNMIEGKWEITNSIEMEGMPAGMMKPQTFTSCLSQRDSVPKDTEQKDCTMKDIKVDGNTVSWEMVCKDSSGKGKVTYAGNTFEGAVETMMKEGSKDIIARMTMKGKHVGPCEK